ncbi:MAG: hypothetical protein ACE5GQ_08790 [Nitrospinales bacterium]
MKKVLTFSVVWAALLILVSVNTASARHETEIRNGVEVEIEHGVEVENEVEIEREFEKFEGIWRVASDPNLFVSFHDEHGATIGIVINISTFEASFILGNRLGNSATFTTSSDDNGGFSASMSGLSKKRAKITINSCVPKAGFTCMLKNGEVELERVY